MTDPLPFRNSPINYLDDSSTDAVAKLKSKIERAEVSLKKRDHSGYLIDLLNALEVPIESQILVFSKTSVQQRLISPKSPRAIYFNDDVTVGWVPGSSMIEVAAQDPLKGAIFYSLSQTEALTPVKRLVWKREDRCLTCHISTPTLNIPGHILRSFQVDESGAPQNGYSQVSHNMPFEKRWGGWYVSGRADNLVHGGNLIGSKETLRHEDEPSFRGVMKDLSSLVDLSRYPSAHSDIVALLLFDHQLHFYNLVTRVQFEHAFDQRSDAEEQLARYALMDDEVPLPGPVIGSTDFAAWYQSVGPRNPDGRSLRELNLKTRLFEHQLSPLVKSKAFRNLPDEVKTRLWDRFREVRPDVVEWAWFE